MVGRALGNAGLARRPRGRVARVRDEYARPHPDQELRGLLDALGALAPLARVLLWAAPLRDVAHATNLYGSTERGAVLGQLVFSTVSWLALTFALGRFIESPLRRLFHCLLFPTLAAWWNVMGWNMVMRAESTAFSWLALWCAALAHLPKAEYRARGTTRRRLVPPVLHAR